MRQLPFAAILALLLCGGAQAARAACDYRGVPNAQLGFRQEYEDARWVVRARVVSARNGDGAARGGLPWTSYRLQVVQSFKGNPPRRLNFFTTRSSAAFYLDRGTAPDIGGEYLLFLNPSERRSDEPREADGAVFVTYNCGNSRRWTALAPGMLIALSAFQVQETLHR